MQHFHTMRVGLFCPTVENWSWSSFCSVFFGTI